MLKKTLIFLLTAVLLTGCSGMNLPDLSSLERPSQEETSQNQDAEEPVQSEEPDEEIPGEKSYKTAQEYVEDNLKSPAFTALSESAGDLVKLEIEGTENSIIYKYILADEYPFDVNAGAKIDAVLFQAAHNFSALKEEISKLIDQEEIGITVKYYYKGSSVVTRDF